MRNKMRLLGILGVAALVIAIATPVSANCIPGKTAGTNNSVDYVYAYWVAPGGSTVAGAIKGKFWQLGNAAINNGALQNFVYYFPGAPGLSMYADMGAAEVAGCPGGTLVTVAETTSTDGSNALFLVDTILEQPADRLNFPYYQQGNHNMVPIPRPRVTSSSRAGSTVNVQFAVDGVMPGAYGPSAAAAIVGLQLVSGSGTADPGRGGAFATLQTLPATGGTFSQAIDCTNTGADQFLGVKVLFADGIVSQYAGATTRINCNPSLADPKYKIVPKKGAPKTNLNPNN